MVTHGVGARHGAVGASAVDALEACVGAALGPAAPSLDAGRHSMTAAAALGAAAPSIPLAARSRCRRGA
jgi:hypothetical protein